MAGLLRVLRGGAEVACLSAATLTHGDQVLPVKSSSSRTSYFSSGFHFRRGLHRVHNTHPGRTWAGLIGAQVPGAAVGRGSRYASATIKKVPTRTGPCCAPSDCYPCCLAPDQRLHFSKYRVQNPKIWKIQSSFNPEQQPHPTNTAITQSTLRASVQHTGRLTVAGMYKNCTKDESPEIGI